MLQVHFLIFSTFYETINFVILKDKPATGGVYGVRLPVCR